MNSLKKKILSCILTLSLFAPAFAITNAAAAENIPAFPGAEGGGMYATGGRGGTVVHVTNLNDSGEGSFRDAVAHTNRIVVFDVGGTINLKSDVSCASNVTIAGQTAPGGKGITLRGGKLSFAGSNIIVRFLSSRPGEKGSGDYDAWGGRAGCRNTIIDHCSIGWANDEQFGLYSDNENQTVQYTIIGPSNCVSYHSKGAHGFGAMYGSNKNTWHHNLLCHSLSRNFRGKVGGTNVTEFVNNVIYNWGYQTAYGTIGRINYVGNYLKMGPSTKGGQCFINLNSGSGYDKFRFYLTGNKLMRADGTPWSETMNANNWDGGIKYNNNATEESLRINEYLPILAQDGTEVSVTPTAQTADEAFETVTSYAGTSVNPADNSVYGYSYSSDTTRTKIDAQVLYETRTGTGSLTGGRDFSTVTDEAVLDAINTYGIQHVDYDSYYPESVLQKEIIDSDNDGMPDEWELARGLDPHNPGDAMDDYLLKGYNNIEYYINDLTVNAFPEGVVEPSPELTELGDDYLNAKTDADAIVLSPSAIKDAGDLVLPTRGKNGSSITWESGSPAVTIKNNEITEIKLPAVANEYATLTANVTCGEFTLKKDFTITLLALPYKFDFGAGAVQEGFAAVTASTIYSENSTYGFTSSSTPADMNRAPGIIPAGSENLYNDQTEGGTNDLHFKTELPNGKYYVTIHYGSWNDEFASIYEIEGVSSGNLASVNAAAYTAETTVTDGVLDVVIKKGNAKYGGYISGLEISTTPPAAPDATYHFDFGSNALQEGYTEVTAAMLYSPLIGYGFDDIIDTPEDSARAASSSPAGQENLYADQVIGEAVFKVDVPNGKYKVTIHYGTWNDEFASVYEIEGASSGSLASQVAAQYTSETEVKDGVLDIAMKKGDAKYGGYINGIDIIQLEEYGPEPDMPYVSELSIEGTNIALSITSSVDAPDASAIIAQYDKNGVLSDVSLHPISGSSVIDDELNENAAAVKVFVWNTKNQTILGLPVSAEV